MVEYVCPHDGHEGEEGGGKDGAEGDEGAERVLLAEGELWFVSIGRCEGAGIETYFRKKRHDEEDCG